jgi:hypothetical protein
MTWQERYIAAHREYTRLNFPHVWADGHYSPTKPRTLKSANDIEFMAVNFFIWNGAHLERTKTAGRKTDKVEVTASGTRLRVSGWLPSTSKKGSTDLKGFFKSPNHAFAIPLTAEVKFKKDTMKEKQIEYMNKMKSLSVLHVIWHDMDDVMETWDFLSRQ